MLLDPAPYLAGAKVVAELSSALRAEGFALEYVDSGGGFGIAYRDEQKPIAPPVFVQEARALFDAAGLADLPMLVEPGRALVGAHGVLVSRVIQPKRSSAGGVARRWLLIDAGMNDLIRPALYQAHHRIEPLELPPGTALVPWRVAGPVCESSDDFGVHPLPDPPPSEVVIRDAGAYGRSMASTYNARPIAAEIFVRGGEIVAHRRAKTTDALVADELA
jgi:diaminopimelate decarboxylase